MTPTSCRPTLLVRINVQKPSAATPEVRRTCMVSAIVFPLNMWTVFKAVMIYELIRFSNYMINSMNPIQHCKIRSILRKSAPNAPDFYLRGVN